jgi:hypothetical protein
MVDLQRDHSSESDAGKDLGFGFPLSGTLEYMGAAALEEFLASGEAAREESSFAEARIVIC